MDVDLGLGALTLLFWFICVQSSPGFIKKPKKLEFLKLMQLIDHVQLCPDCEIVRTPRSRHCGTCNQCVERFDHHCPWINNCIGINNHKYFMIFVTLLILNILLNFGLTLYNLIEMWTTDTWSLNDDYIHFLDHAVKDNKAVIITCSIIVLAITFFFFIPVTVLLTVHIKNFCQNRTTNERFGGKRYGKKDDDSESDEYSATTSILADEIVKEIGEPIDFSNRHMTWFFNCKEMWWSSRIPDQ